MELGKSPRRYKTVNARSKILTIISTYADVYFTEIDVYKTLLLKQEKMSVFTVANKLKQLSEKGFLVGEKNEFAARIYKKSGNFQELLSLEEFKPHLFI